MMNASKKRKKGGSGRNSLSMRRSTVRPVVFHGVPGLSGEEVSKLVVVRKRRRSSRAPFKLEAVEDWCTEMGKEIGELRQFYDAKHATLEKEYRRKAELLTEKYHEKITKLESFQECIKSLPNLADLLFEYGNTKDKEGSVEEALKYYEAASALDHFEARSAYANLALNNPNKLNEEEMERIHNLLQEKWNSGDTSTGYNLGRMYENGWGVIANGDTAVHYYREAARKGDAIAMFHVITSPLSKRSRNREPQQQ